MLRTITFAAFLTFVLTTSGNAGTLTVSALCLSDDSQGVILGTSVYCHGILVGSASATITSPASVGLSVSGYTASVSVGISYESEEMVTFFGGIGTFSYVPCLSVSYQPGPADAGASFGPANVSSALPVGGPCVSGQTSGDVIPFTYGVPQVQLLNLYAMAGDASAYAGINGFDAPSGTTYTVTEIPEPALLWPACLALVFGYRFSRRRA